MQEIEKVLPGSSLWTQNNNEIPLVKSTNLNFQPVHTSSLSTQSKQLNTYRSWLVVISAALLFFIISIQINLFNAINPFLIKGLHFNALQISLLSSCYFYTNVLTVFPAGMLLDRFSIKKILFYLFFILIFSVYLFANTTSFWIMMLCRGLIGAVGSFSLLSCLKLATRWFSQKKISFVIGVVVTLAMFGGMIAQTPMTLLADHYGWRIALLSNVYISIFSLLLILICVTDYPNNKKYSFIYKILYKTLQENSLSFWQSLNRVIRNSQNWFMGFYLVFMNLPVFLLGSTWGNLYLVQAHNLTREHSSYIITMLFVGIIIGSPLIGWLAKNEQVRKVMMYASAFFSLLVILAMMYIPNLTFEYLLIWFFILGFCCSAQVISYPIIVENNISDLVATATGFVCMFSIFNGFALPIFSWLLERNWSGKTLYGLPYYDRLNYNLAFSLLIVTGLLLIALIPFIKEKK